MWESAESSWTSFAPSPTETIGEDSLRRTVAMLSGANRELYQKLEVESAKVRQLRSKVDEQESVVAALVARREQEEAKHRKELLELCAAIEALQSESQRLDDEEAAIGRRMEEIDGLSGDMAGRVAKTKEQLAFNFDLPLRTARPLSRGPTTTGESFLAVDAGSVFRDAHLGEVAAVFATLGRQPHAIPASAVVPRTRRPSLIVLQRRATLLSGRKLNLEAEYDRGALFSYEYQRAKEALWQEEEQLLRQVAQLTEPPRRSPTPVAAAPIDDDDVAPSDIDPVWDESQGPSRPSAELLALRLEIATQQERLRNGDPPDTPVDCDAAFALSRTAEETRPESPARRSGRNADRTAAAKPRVEELAVVEWEWIQQPGWLVGRPQLPAAKPRRPLSARFEAAATRRLGPRSSTERSKRVKKR